MVALVEHDLGDIRGPEPREQLARSLDAREHVVPPRGYLAAHQELTEAAVRGQRTLLVSSIAP